MRPARESLLDSAMLVTERDLQVQHLFSRALKAEVAWLDDAGLYVALINGFPHGTFHGTAVKAAVYAPDWRDTSRLAYTLSLIDVLRQLLPADVEGSISTTPKSASRDLSSSRPMRSSP